MKLNPRTLIYFYFFGVLVNLLVALLIREPGYMDAEYYYAGAQRIAAGLGDSEPYIWNYLSSPQELPAPSFTYWMPLTSLLASLSLLVTGVDHFLAARMLVIVISGFIPVITVIIATKFTNSKAGILLAGIISIFPVYYQPYISNTDSFTIYMLLGGLLLLLFIKVFQGTEKWFHFFLLGLITGLIHLCRADGLLVFLFACGAIIFRMIKKRRTLQSKWNLLLPLFFLLIGYLFVMGSWYVRNLSEFQTFMPPGNTLLLFSTSYNDIFKVFTDQLTPDRFLSQGVGTIVLIRGKAFWENIKSILAVNGSLFLSPLIIIGIWKTRNMVLTKLTAGFIFLNLMTMSILFPFAGYRGGFFHTNSLTQTALWALVPVGLEVALDYGSRVRKWNYQQSWRVFSIAITAGLFLLSAFMVLQRITPGGDPEFSWNGRLAGFQMEDSVISEKTGDVTSNIMVNDPPGYHLATGRNAVVVPTDNLEAVFQVAEQFAVRFMILDKNNVEINHELAGSYAFGHQIILLVDLGDIRIYEFLER